MPIDRPGPLFTVSRTAADSRNSYTRKEFLEDEVVYWGLRGYTRFLKALGDATELSGGIADKITDLLWIVIYRPLSWLLGRFSYRIGGH